METKSSLDLPPWVADALGAERVNDFALVSGRVEELDHFTAMADTTDVVLVPLDPARARRWKAQARRLGQDWVFVVSDDGKTTLAIDEPTDLGLREPAAGVMFPELHTQMTSWWLAHAWRAVDLLQDALHAFESWRITSAAVVVRALMEQTGCLLVESKKLAAAWSDAKALPSDDLARPAGVRSLMSPTLIHAAFGSRLMQVPEKLRATNVMTYVQKLTRETDDRRYLAWYDWLSDSAHPAFGARIALAGPPFVHGSGAVMSRTYARSPLSLQGSNGRVQHLHNEVAINAADALVAVTTMLFRLLAESLLVVDDFGLTTAAATRTRRRYWRNFAPVRGSRPCPCGRGAWSKCNHRWGQECPPVSGLPVRGDTR